MPAMKVEEFPSSLTEAAYERDVNISWNLVDRCDMIVEVLSAFAFIVTCSHMLISPLLNIEL